MKIRNPFKKRKAAHLELGEQGESRAARFLKKKGYKIIGRNVRCGKHDEIDLIARKGGHLIFVEVKTRRSTEFGRPYCAITPKKIKRLRRAAKTYLNQQKKIPAYFQFDVIEVVWPLNENPQLNHVPHAFQIEPQLGARQLQK